MRKIIFASMLFAVGAVILGLNFYENVSAQTSEEKLVADVLRQNAAAFAKNDLAAMDKIWLNGADVTVFESGYADYGWTDYRDHHLAPEMKEFKNTKYEYTDIKAKVSGDLAYATMKYTLSADIDKKPVNSAGLATAVLEKQNGSWKIVHWHSSAPRRTASPTPTPAKKP